MAELDAIQARGNTAPAPSPRPVPKPRLPSSDAGTVALHWLTVTALIVSLATGLRIASDALDAPVSQALAPILPQGELWSIHLASGLSVFFCATAYVLYMTRSGLQTRVSGRRLRPLLERRNARVRWGALNVLLHWVLYGLLATLTATGVLLFLGHGGWIVSLHLACAFATIGYVVVHVTTHYLFGGWRQLLRIVRPLAPLGARARSRPFLVAALVGLVVAGGLFGLDRGARDVLRVVRVDTPPILDGRLDDAAWRVARPVSVRTAQGANLGGTGESLVEIRAVRDDQKIYFAFRWEDPTRSLRRLPLVKRADGWHMIGSGADVADVVDYYEDKLAVMFAPSDGWGGDASIHLGARPLADRPAPLHGRGEHYTTDGSVIDVWHWKSTRGGLLGQADDQHFGPPRDPTPAEAAGQLRYQAGYWNDPGEQAYLYNYKVEPPGGYRGPVQVVRLPKDVAAMTARMGPFDPDPDSSMDARYPGWWMLESETVPFSAEADEAIPVGTVIPGIVIRGPFTGDRGQVAAGGQWQDGHWTVELSRDLVSGSPYDQDFVAGRPLFLWVAVFDHNETRHTRHPRPVRIEIE
jgi:cytochrome b561